MALPRSYTFSAHAVAGAARSVPAIMAKYHRRSGGRFLKHSEMLPDTGA